MELKQIQQVGNTLEGIASIATTVSLSPLLRRWYSRWGADAELAEKTLPGDDIVREPKLSSTRAVMIDAPPTRVWPWLVQIGQGRGGMYSYDSLENFVGCQMESANRILPQFQELAVGEIVKMDAEGYLGYRVVQVEPPRTLILQIKTPQTGEPGPATWAFILEESGEDNAGSRTTRLISRQRLDYPSNLGNRVFWRLLIDPVNFVMERKMLLGIKKRAERSVPPAAILVID